MDQGSRRDVDAEPTQDDLYTSPLDRPAVDRQKRSQAMRDIAIGLICVIAGIAITVVTYQLADGGGRYVVTWGLVLIGIIQMARGLWNLRR